jgi:hypothetical protein
MVSPKPEDVVIALQALGLCPGAVPLSTTDALQIRLVPRDESLQSKDIPVDVLLAKMTAARDKMRVLEQRVNAADIDAAERARLHQHINAMYVALHALATFPTEQAIPASEPRS